MKQKLHYLILLFLPTFFYSQNVIYNGSFETNMILPYAEGQYYWCNGWDNCDGGGSPDYFHMNGTGYGKMPDTYASTVHPQHGNAVMGISIYESTHPNFREYLTAGWDNPLVVGQTYQLSFYISNGNAPIKYGGLGTDHFSVALTTTPLQQGGVFNSDPITTVIPQYTYNGILYSNSWQLLSYQFVADQPYQYITFGSFVNDTSMQIQQFSTAITNACAYYYIDNVNLSIPLSIEEQENAAAIQLYQNTTTGNLTIESNNDIISELMIYDLNGRLLIQKSYSRSTTISTDSLSKGIYIYSIKQENGNRKQGKILIQ
ncbi:T9SS type A sorting domain-containing protein [Flavobacterium wongokense]|uniref:T9SS type A sorting domain-containing protein n=1 Tax=Flavobacterium wongokense TaxID=2910674 RepID=UPI001F3F7B72|nr:T9SS type A sorting domain-containing protein [Flavobacterium sp. WG47]MCF6132391.1 T9SS type A sorting domain-containing protein [Flavobacterium sp. WG47]